jgi:hypothetical protein
MPKEVLGYDLEGNKLTDSPQSAKAQADFIFEQGKLVMCISELYGHLSVQILGAPSLKVLELMEQGVKVYKKILKDKGLL